MRRHRRSTQRRRARRGVELLEFCFVLPAMVFLTGFAIDMSRIMLVKAYMKDSTYQAARAGATYGSAFELIGTGNVPASELAQRDVIRKSALPNHARNIRLQVLRDCDSIEGSARSDRVTVQVTYDLPLVTPGLGRLMAVTGRSAVDIPNALAGSDTVTVRCEVVR